MWQGQVWEARPDGESTRGKAKFGKRYGSRKWEEENSATRRRHRGKGRKRQKTPTTHTMCHTPHWASAGRLAFYYFVFLKGSKAGSQNGAQAKTKRRNENVIQFWTPFWGPYLENFAAAHICCAGRFATLQLEHACQLTPFSLCASQVRLLLSISLYRSHVLTTFLGPVSGAMMKQVCWHSRRSKAY